MWTHKALLVDILLSHIPGPLSNALDNPYDIRRADELTRRGAGALRSLILWLLKHSTMPLDDQLRYIWWGAYHYNHNNPSRWIKCINRSQNSLMGCPPIAFDANS